MTFVISADKCLEQLEEEGSVWAIVSKDSVCGYLTPCFWGHERQSTMVAREHHRSFSLSHGAGNRESGEKGWEPGHEGAPETDPKHLFYPDRPHLSLSPPPSKANKVTP